MNKSYATAIIITALSLGQNASAETLYIDDKIKIWSRTGPTNGYNVKYKLLPGTKLEVLQKDPESGFVEVKEASGRTSWVDPQFLTADLTSHQLLDAANNQINSIKQSNLKRVSGLEKRLNELEPLEAINKELQSRLAKQENELEQLRQKAKVYENGFNSEATITGSVIVLAGMFLGWLLSKIGGRKRNTGWS